jgi:HK97 gp10 family phage protein
MQGFTVGGELKGMADAVSRLHGLRQGAANRVLRPAIAKGCRIIAKAVKACIRPSGRTYTRKKVAKDFSVEERQVRGLLKKSIGAVVKVEKGVVTGKVGARRGFKVAIGKRIRGKWKGKTIYYSPSRVVHLVELGHGGKHAAGPHPFLRPGFNNSKDEAAAVIADEIKARIAARVQSKMAA